MTAQTVGVAARKPPRGRPFQRGDDPRRNRGGKPKALLSQAAAEALTPADAAATMQQVIAQAKRGELPAIAMLWDRLEGKAIARSEQGEPGDFTGLEEVPTPELLKIVESA